jgi:hypothetical protein
MIERLLFDGVDTKTRAAAVGVQNHASAQIASHEAKSTVAVAERAGTGAEVADNPAGACGMPPAAAYGPIWAV